MSRIGGFLSRYVRKRFVIRPFVAGIDEIREGLSEIGKTRGEIDSLDRGSLLSAWRGPSSARTGAAMFERDLARSGMGPVELAAFVAERSRTARIATMAALACLVACFAFFLVTGSALSLVAGLIAALMSGLAALVNEHAARQARERRIMGFREVVIP